MPFNKSEFLNQLGTISTIDEFRKSLLDLVPFKASNDFNIAQGRHAHIDKFALYCNLSIWIDKVEPTCFFCVVKWSCPILLTNSTEDHLGLHPDKPLVSLKLTQETYNNIINNEVRPLMLELVSSHTKQLEEGVITYQSSQGFYVDIQVCNPPYQCLSPASELVKDQVLLLFPFHFGLVDEEFSVVVRKLTHSFLNNDPVLDIFGIFS